MFTLLLICLAGALLYAIGWLTMRGRIVPTALVLWIAFPIYEWWVRANCTGECNIRVDWVLLLPVLLIVSLLALAQIARSAWRKHRASK